MTVGERIKELRLKLGVSQVDFADKINVSKQTLYKYENDIITNIPSDKIEKIADVCGVSPAHIMGWDNDYYRTDIEISGLNGLTSILEYIYKDIVYEEIPAAYDYDTFEVKFTANNSKVRLTEMQFDLLFQYVCSSIQTYIKILQDTLKLTVSQSNRPYVNAAHANDYTNAPDKLKQEKAIMDDDNFGS